MASCTWILILLGLVCLMGQALCDSSSSESYSSESYSSESSSSESESPSSESSSSERESSNSESERSTSESSSSGSSTSESESPSSESESSSSESESSTSENSSSGSSTSESESPSSESESSTSESSSRESESSNSESERSTSGSESSTIESESSTSESSSRESESSSSESERSTSESSTSESYNSESLVECPYAGSLDPVENFDETKFLGKYYRYRWYWSTFMTIDEFWSEAAATFYTKPGQDAMYRQYNIKDEPDSNCTVTAEMKFLRESQPGAYRMYHSNRARNNTRTTVLATDYDTYLVLHYCLQQVRDCCSGQMVHLFTREPVINSKLLCKMEAALSDMCYHTPEVHGNSGYQDYCDPVDPPVV